MSAGLRARLLTAADGYEKESRPLTADLLREAAAALDGQGDAAPRVAASQHEDDIVWRIELFRESDGRFSANFWSGDNTIGGMSNYANTPVGALAELCATLIKLDEDDAHDRRDAAPATSGSGDEAREQQEQEKKKDDAGLPR